MTNSIEYHLKMKGIVRYVSDCEVVFTRGPHIWISDDCGNSIRKLPILPTSVSSKFLNSFRLVRRLLRSDVSNIKVLSSTSKVVMAHDNIYRYDADNEWMYCSSIVGHRPLFLMRTPTDHLFYGEYRANAERSPVSVWCSADSGETWRPAWTFDNVRHIHGVFYDSYTESIWVTTGDDNEECGLWITRDNFANLDLVVGGTQQQRAIQLLFTKRYVYFGTDSPLEINQICRLDRKTNKIEILQSVSGSVFYGCKVNDNLFFSTAVEPSVVNKSRYACLWGSPDGYKWKCLTKYRKDIWPMKLFQYGQIIFPAGDNQTRKLWFTPWATEYDQTIQCIDVTKIDWD